MVNERGERELAYVVRVDAIVDTGIEGVRNKLALVGGWHIFVKPDDFHAGDLAVYIEIDSLCPYNEIFEFLDAKYDENGKCIGNDKHKIKTQRYIKGQVLSQGLLMRIEDCKLNHDVKEGDFLTKELDITYYEPEDNARKADSVALKVAAVERAMRKFERKHPMLFKIVPVRWVYQKYVTWKIYKSKAAKKSAWPSWVSKTDEERCQNLSWLFNPESEMRAKIFERGPFYVTEKIDGTSTTFTMRQAKPEKREMLVCSRNVVFNKPGKKSFYDETEGNVYLEMAAKYDMEKVVTTILNEHPILDFITIQGETYGGNIQKRDYGPEHKLAIFNIIYQENGKAPVRLNPLQMFDFVDRLNRLHGFNLETVPIIDNNFIIPETCEELLAMAEGESQIDGKEREGWVIRSADGSFSFKAVSNAFLTKYHN